jgi:hypothetical protein
MKIISDSISSEDTRTLYYIGARVVMAEDKMKQEDLDNMRLMMRFNRL